MTSHSCLVINDYAGSPVLRHHSSFTPMFIVDFRVVLARCLPTTITYCLIYIKPAAAVGVFQSTSTTTVLTRHLSTTLVHPPFSARTIKLPSAQQSTNRNDSTGVRPSLSIITREEAASARLRARFRSRFRYRTSTTNRSAESFGASGAETGVPHRLPRTGDLV